MSKARSTSQARRRMNAGDLILIITVPTLLVLTGSWVIGAINEVIKKANVLLALQTLQAYPVILFLFALISLVLLSVGVLTLFYFPLSLSFEFARGRSIYQDRLPYISVVVPAYNEALVLRNCVRSLLQSDYERFEVILVDDGSQDDTLAIMREFQKDPRIRIIAKENSGKASALNAGMQAAIGEVLFFVDADGLFRPDTMKRMLAGFTGEQVGAVCGNDEPVNLDRLQTHLIALQSHIGTGFVRRALARLNCLPIVSGNIGAFRRVALAAAMDQIGPQKSKKEDQSLTPFLEGFIGEDLELTWRVHEAGYRVNFAPNAMVLAEVPSTLRDLWKQRVRWARGFLQTARLHKRMFFNVKHGAIGLYLPVNYFNMVILPFLQVGLLLLLLILGLAGFSPVAFSFLGLILWLGIVSTLVACLWAISLDHAWKHLKYLYVLFLWIPYSLMMNFVMIRAVTLELTHRQALWNKVQRTGNVTRS